MYQTAKRYTAASTINTVCSKKYKTAANESCYLKNAVDVIMTYKL